MPPTWDELVERNRVYSESKHQPMPFIGEADFAMPTVFVYTCCDPRASAEQFLSLNPGDALVVRNLGGQVRHDVLPLLFIEALSQGQALKDIVVIHHTNCGCTNIGEQGVKDYLETQAPGQKAEIQQFVFGTYDGGSIENHETNVRKDMDFFRSSPLIRQELKDRVHGYVYDIKTGRLIPVH